MQWSEASAPQSRHFADCGASRRDPNPIPSRDVFERAKKPMSEPSGISDKTLEQLRGWGGSRELSAFEAMMWLAEADPRLRSTTTSVLILDRAPDWERLVAGHEWTSRAVPRFRQRVLEPALGLGMPEWVDDPGFQLDYHLRRLR